MVKIAARTNIEGAIAYFLSDAALTESERHGRWIGPLAERLQIDRSEWISRSAFERALRGLAPSGPLCGLELFASSRPTPRVAWELVFTPHKSLSIAAVQTSDRSLATTMRELVAHASYRTMRTAVAPMLRARTRIKEGQESNSYLGAAFAHTHSRRLDPHYHIHVLVMNTTYHDLVGWRRLEPRTLFRKIRSVTEAFDDELASGLKAAGLPFTRTAIGALNVPVLTRFAADSPTLSSGTATIKALAASTPPPLGVSAHRWAQRLNNRSRPAKDTRRAMMERFPVRARIFSSLPCAAELGPRLADAPRVLAELAWRQQAVEVCRAHISVKA